MILFLLFNYYFSEAKKPRLTSHSEKPRVTLKRSQSCPIITAAYITALESPLPTTKTITPTAAPLEQNDNTPTQSNQKRIRRKRMIIPIDSDYDDTDDEILNLAQINEVLRNSAAAAISITEADKTIESPESSPRPVEVASETQRLTDDAQQRPQRKIPDRLGDSFHTKAARAERKQTAVVNKLVREARKVAKKKKKVEHR